MRARDANQKRESHGQFVISGSCDNVLPELQFIMQFLTYIQKEGFYDKKNKKRCTNEICYGH